MDKKKIRVLKNALKEEKLLSEALKKDMEKQRSKN